MVAKKVEEYDTVTTIWFHTSFTEKCLQLNIQATALY